MSSNAPIRVMQIIAFALLAGPSVFLALAIFLARPDGPELPIISAVAAVVCAGNAIASFVLPAAMTRSSLERIAKEAGPSTEAGPAALANDEAKLLALRQTTMITGMALLEGAAFLACIAIILEGQLFIVAAAVLLILVMLARFPTLGRVQTWLDTQMMRLAELRQQRDIAAL